MKTLLVERGSFANITIVLDVVHVLGPVKSVNLVP